MLSSQMLQYSTFQLKCETTIVKPAGIFRGPHLRRVPKQKYHVINLLALFSPEATQLRFQNRDRRVQHFAF
jgi:hypothetical protein